MQTPGSVFRICFEDKSAADNQTSTNLRTLPRRDITRARLFMAAFGFFIVYGLIAGRLVLMAANNGKDATLRAHVADNSLLMARPDLVDRHGEVLAKDVNTYSLHANPQKMLFPEEALDQLATILPHLDRGRLLSRLQGKGSFVWIERELTPRQRAEIFDLGIPGLEFRRETSRFYPGGPTASHLLGHVDIDNHGIAGFEKFVDDMWLNDLRAVGFASNKRMEPVALSIDIRAQHAVRDELRKAMDAYQAVAAIGIILDAHTGEVIAMSSLPDYDPNQFEETFSKDALNRATAGVFEMGSTFKTFTTAMALDSGKVSIHDTVDASKPLREGGATIRDYRAKNRVLSVPEVFIYSSNIGTAKLASLVGIDKHRAFLTRLGLLSPGSHELPEIGKPQYPSIWKKLSSMTISFGHGVSVTPLQFVSAVAAMVNGGKLLPPTFRPRSFAEAEDLAKQVISSKTSQHMRYLFRLNVEKGSGKRAEVAGYAVGGKTGTAEKVVNGRYSSDKKLNSFVSAFPMNDPRYVVLVIVDEPNPLAGQQFATAGLNAAPTTAAIIGRVATSLGVAPRLHDDVPVLTEISMAE